MTGIPQIIGMVFPLSNSVRTGLESICGTSVIPPESELVILQSTVRVLKTLALIATGTAPRADGLMVRRAITTVNTASLRPTLMPTTPSIIREYSALWSAGEVL